MTPKDLVTIVLKWLLVVITTLAMVCALIIGEYGIAFIWAMAIPLTLALAKYDWKRQ